jgi:predicted DNA-binding transcriptional regulator YafY
MPANPKQKLKLLYLYKMLNEQTDADHGLSTSRIIEQLAAEGISAERKSIYRDFKVLREFGCQIDTIQRMPVEYTLRKTGLDLAELTLLVDAVQSSKFLTQRTASRLSDKVADLASIHQREALKGRVHVDGRIKSQSDSVFYNVDIIHDALRRNCKISFLYYKYNEKLRATLQHNGKPYKLTPVQLVYSDGFYYLITWSDTHEDFVRFRVDRMRMVQVSDEPATHNVRIANYAHEDFAYQAFGMYDGEAVPVTLLVAPGAMDIVVDRFGRDLHPHALEDGSAEVGVTVRKSSLFFGWVAGMNGAVRIVRPDALVDEYRAWLRGLLDEG